MSWDDVETRVGAWTHHWFLVNSVVFVIFVWKTLYNQPSRRFYYVIWRPLQVFHLQLTDGLFQKAVTESMANTCKIVVKSMSNKCNIHVKATIQLIP